MTLFVRSMFPVLGLLCVLLAGMGHASAQASMPADECGAELARQGDYEAAVEPMTRCFERTPSMSLAFNLAIVLRNAGQARRALGLLDEIAQGTFGVVPDSRRGALAAQRETTLASVATIIVTFPGVTGTTEISIDGLETHQVAPGSTSATFHVDPGAHAITATGDVCADREVLSVSRGDRREVTLRMTPCRSEVPEALGEDAAELPGVQTAGNNDDVILGVGVGVGVALAVGAIILGVVLSSGPEDPTCGVRVCIETLVATEPLLRF